MQYIDNLLDILEAKFYKGPKDEFPRYEITKDLKEIFYFLEDMREKGEFSFENLYSFEGFEINKKIVGNAEIFTYEIDGVIFWHDENPHLKEIIDYFMNDHPVKKAEN